MNKSVPMLWRLGVSLLVGFAVSTMVFYCLEGWRSAPGEPLTVRVWSAKLGDQTPLALQGDLKASVSSRELRLLAPSAAVASSAGDMPGVLCAPMWQLAELAAEGRIATGALEPFEYPAEWEQYFTADGRAKPTYAIPSFSVQLVLACPDGFIAALPLEWQERLRSGRGLTATALTELLATTAKSRGIPGFGRQLYSDPYLLALVSTVLSNEAERKAFFSELARDAFGIEAPTGAPSPVIGLLPDVEHLGLVVPVVRGNEFITDTFGYAVAALGERQEDQLVPIATALSDNAIKAGVAGVIPFDKQLAGVHRPLAPFTRYQIAWAALWTSRDDPLGAGEQMFLDFSRIGHD